MKRMLFVFAVAITAFSCKKEAAESTDLPLTIEEPQASGPLQRCFLYTSGKDSIRLAIIDHNNHASGRLEFKMFEKDNSDGTISGTFIGDTLFADYTFRAEGTKSVREMVFLRRQNQLIVGTGTLEEKGDKQIFSDPSSISFESGVVLKAVACK